MDGLSLGERPQVESGAVRVVAVGFSCASTRRVRGGPCCCGEVLLRFRRAARFVVSYWVYANVFMSDSLHVRASGVLWPAT